MAPQKPAKGWRKSSYSQGANNCVEVGQVEGGAAVRDTKNREAGYFTVDRAQWTAFINKVKSGELDG
jgi:hypothetical protein